MTGSRVVVVLGGGGAKAASQAGVALALAEHGVEPIRWIGTSMGSAVAASLAAGRSPVDLIARMEKMRAADLVVRERLALFKGIWAQSLLTMEPLRRLFRDLVPVERFDQLNIPCSITAVDVDNGDAVIFGEGGANVPLHDAIAASCALPPYFAPVEVQGRRYYDGGLRGPLALWAAADIDCDVVIAVDAGPGFDESGPSRQSPPPFLAAADAAMGWLMAGTTSLLLESWRANPSRPRLVYLRPISERGATFAVDRVSHYAAAGRAAMQARISEVR
jgi:NTE family protein